MTNAFQIGQKVESTRMGSSSFYKRVRGTVTDIRNGFVEIDATEVIDRWSKSWERHPLSDGCSCAARIEDVISITPKP